MYSAIFHVKQVQLPLNETYNSGEIIVREVPQIILCEEVFLDHDKCERFVEREVNKMSDKQRRRVSLKHRVIIRKRI